MKHLTFLTCLASAVTAAALGSPAPRIDFSEPGSLRIMRGAFRYGGEQICYGPAGATVKLDAARTKPTEPTYYALAPVPASKDDWRGRRVSLFVKFGERPAARRSLSLDFHDADGETFRYKPVFILPQGDVTRLDYLVTEKGVSLKTWGKKVNGRFDGALRLGALLGSYAAGGAGEIVYVRLVASDDVLTRTIDAFVPISDDKTYPGPKPMPTFEEVLKTPSGRVGRLKATAVEALDFDVDTGDQLHLIRDGRGTPTLVFTNLSRGTRRWKGTISFRDHFERGFDQAVDVTAEPEGAIRVALERPLPYKGFWRVFAELTGDDGQTGMKEARFAAIDRHEVTPALPKPFFRMGINFHAQHYWNNAHFEKTFDALVASGAKLVRSGGFKFADVAKTPEYDWKMTDALVAAYRARGIAINANVYPGPAWARVPQPDGLNGMRHRMNLPTRPGLFRDYCAAIAARYGTKIDYYEMGNEWDLTSDRVLPPDEALRLLREGYAGIKASCPSATVIPCGWAYADSSGQKNMPNPGLIEKFAGTAQDAFDVWALHLHGPFESYAERLQKQFFPMRKRLGLDVKPWYSNETALNTAGDEDEAARAVWQKILYAWAWGSTDYIWYNLRATGWNPSAGEDSYGLVTPDYRPRATFAAFAALATLIEGGHFDARLVDAGLRHIYRFHSPGGKGLTIAGWDAGCWKGEALRIRSDAKSASAVDLMGNRTELKPADGVWTWTVSREPSAIVLDGATIATLEPVKNRQHPDSGGWEDVFNKDLSNAECAKPGWAWDKDGYLVPGTGETLFSKKDYKNFVLDLAYVMDPTANSGVFLYDTDHPKYKFEVQILDDHHPCYSNEVPYQLTGAIYGRCAPRKVVSKPAGELNRMTCWCEGARVRVVVNGEEVVDADLTDWKDPLVNPDGTTVPKWHKGFPALGTIPMHGRIALQGIHGGKAVRFKYLKAKEL